MHKNNKNKAFNNKKRNQELAPADGFVVSTPQTSGNGWITDGAWMTGVVGCVSTLVIAFFCFKYSWLQTGVDVFGLFEVKGTIEVQMLCLIVAALTMCFSELARLSVVSPVNVIRFAPELLNGNYVKLIGETVWRYLCYLLIISCVFAFYEGASEYGYARNAPYYQAWFTMGEWLYSAFLWLGFPYVFLTYTFKHNKEKDDNSYHRLVECAIIFLVTKVKIGNRSYPIDSLRFKKIALGLLVRIFFIPLMTAFFTHHFPHLVSNFGYIFDTLPSRIAEGNYSHASFNRDFLNIAKPIIFSIDIVLAWCGYVFTSRWLDNETQSAEPTLLGWFA